MLRLVIEDDEGKTTVVPLIRDEITIGRKDGNTIRLTERNVSRRHARLFRTGDNGNFTVFLEDLDSYNGVHLNGDHVQGKCTVQPGDLIQIGDYSLALRVDQSNLRDAQTQVEAQAPPGIGEVELLPLDEQARLVVVSSNLAGTTFFVDRPEVIIGRIDENDLVVNHRSISRNHAKIIVREGAFTIVDLASSNGVQVNGDNYGTASLINGDIVELGQVKMRYCAPGDDYTFTRADIEDVELDGGPSTAKLVLIALILVAVAVVAFLGVRKWNRSSSPGPSPQIQVPKQPKAQSDFDSKVLLDEGQEHLKALRWREAERAFERIIQTEPQHEEALRLDKIARQENSNQERLSKLRKEVEAQQWSEAYFLFTEFARDSVYFSEVSEMRSEIEEGFAQSELERGRDLITYQDLEGAGNLQLSLAQKPFAQKQAKLLNEEIKTAAQAQLKTNKLVRRSRSIPKASRRRPAPKPDLEPEPPSDPEHPAVDEEEEYDKVMDQAMSLFIQGKRNQAAEFFERAQRLKPGAKEAHARLCAIYPTMGRLKRALFHCKRNLKIENDPSHRKNLKRIIEGLERELDL